jgi:hypothetical protein
MSLNVTMRALGVVFLVWRTIPGVTVFVQAQRALAASLHRAQGASSG